jgi:penicillin-binding protein 2
VERLAVADAPATPYPEPAATYVRDDLRSVQRRIVVVLVASAALFVLLLGRLWLLQVVQGPRWRMLSENNRLRRIPLEAPRGVVTDVRGDIVLGNRSVFQLLLFPEEMEDPGRTARFLIDLGIATAEEVHARIEKARRTSHLPSVLADNLTWRQVAAIAAHRAEYQELEVHPATRRAFPDGPGIAHLAGQLGEADPGQLAADPSLHAGQLVGRSGLERAYDQRLGGTPGNLVVVVDALGRQISELTDEPPMPGRPMQVTLDLALQREAVAAMAGQVGAVFAIDPRDGAVRVLLSQPAFDPELFAGHLEPTLWRELVDDPLKPLHNRALQALYSPGSAIKPIFAAGALTDGARSPASRDYCTGGVVIYGHPYRCWMRGGHGGVDLERAIEVSCDTFFYHLARDAGIDRIGSWARALGLGQPTGIELPGESSGLVPDDAWSRRARGQPWYGGETISVGIGQGPILVTPAQLAVAYAALVNGGRLVKPHLVPGQAAGPRPVAVDPVALATVRRGMERVVAGASGTARRLASLPISIAGKTGTSQVVRKQEGVRWQDLPWSSATTPYSSATPHPAHRRWSSSWWSSMAAMAPRSPLDRRRILQRAFGPPPQPDAALVAQAPAAVPPVGTTPESRPNGNGDAAP